MEKNVKVTVWEDKAVKVEALYNDFRGTTSEWKEAIYTMFRWNMTWDYAYYIDVRETRSSGVKFVTLIRPAYKDQVLETMRDLGFKPVASDESVGAIECSDFPEDMLLDHVFID